MTLLIALLDSLLIFSSFLLGFVCLLAIYEPAIVQSHFLLPLSCAIQPGIWDGVWKMGAVIFLGIASLSLFFRWIRILSNNDVFFVSTKGNTMQISNKAITDFINKLIDTVESVEQAEVRVLTNRGHNKIFVKIRINLYEGAQYPQVNERIESLITSRIPQELGIHKIGGIYLDLRKIVPLPLQQSAPIPQTYKPPIPDLEGQL